MPKNIRKFIILPIGTQDRLNMKHGKVVNLYDILLKFYDKSPNKLMRDVSEKKQAG